jgi:hypothetical protein
LASAINTIPALPFRAEPWDEVENFNDAFALMKKRRNPTARSAVGLFSPQREIEKPFQQIRQASSCLR